MKTASVAVTLVSASSLLLALAGCGLSGAPQDPTAKARLDRETGQIVLPLDEYAPSEADERSMTAARLAILRSCLQPQGHNGVKPPAAAPTEPAEERRYGLWLVERARAYGPHLPPAADTTDTPPPGGWSDESDPAFIAAYDECVAQVMDHMVAVSTPPDGGVVLTIETQAASLAAQDPQWKAARAEWHRCLRDNGLTPQEEEGAWSTAESEAMAASRSSGMGDADTAREETRLAVIEATCNEQTDLTQRLGDIEASYQAPLITQYETALTQELETNMQHIDAARDYLATHQ